MPIKRQKKTQYVIIIFLLAYMHSTVSGMCRFKQKPKLSRRQSPSLPSRGRRNNTIIATATTKL